ncbi:MAG: YciI family protein [Chloroflexota bacterium]
MPEPNKSKMKYMLLIYSDESLSAHLSQSKMSDLVTQYASYTKEMVEAGVFIATEGLQPTATATTVTRKSGDILTTHGPFAETKEQLGGFYLISCDNLDEAMAWASKCPTATVGSIEIRPVMNY